MHIKGKIVGPIGVLILIIGGLTAISGFSAVSEIDKFQYVEISNGTLIVDDLEGGFTVYVDYPPVDLNNNQIHDLCENIVITATHDGKWISGYETEFPEGEASIKFLSRSVSSQNLVSYWKTINNHSCIQDYPNILPEPTEPSVGPGVIAP